MRERERETEVGKESIAYLTCALPQMPHCFHLPLEDKQREKHSERSFSERQAVRETGRQRDASRMTGSQRDRQSEIQAVKKNKHSERPALKKGTIQQKQRLALNRP